MRETGIVNREICDMLSTLGHTDEIRTGDFTAYSNIVLVSGGGDRWYIERR